MHGSIHAPRCRMLTITADYTTQNSMQFELVRGTPFRQLTLSSHQASPDRLCCVRLHVSPSSFNAVYSKFWLSESSTTFPTCRQSQTMFSTCRFRSRKAAGSSLLCDPQRHPRTSSRYAATCSSHAFVHLPLSQVFRFQIG